MTFRNPALNELKQLSAVCGLRHSRARAEASRRTSEMDDARQALDRRNEASDAAREGWSGAHRTGTFDPLIASFWRGHLDTVEEERRGAGEVHARAVDRHAAALSNWREAFAREEVSSDVVTRARRAEVRRSDEEGARLAEEIRFFRRTSR